MQSEQVPDGRSESAQAQQQRILHERQIRDKALQFFQERELLDLAEQMTHEDADLLRKKVREGPLVERILAIRVVSKRRLALEKDLIEVLKDPEESIRQLAREALTHIGRGTDFGPIPGASKTGIERSVEKWQHWLALQQGESADTLSHKAITTVLEHELQTAPAVSPEAMRLCDELVKARGDERTKVLERLRDARGIDNTDALALAIPKLPIDVQHQARDVLAERMTRMKASTLRDKLQDNNVDVRRAAALACGIKKETEHIPELLQLLDDPERPVIQAARKALKELTGEDFGPDEEAGSGGRARAAAAWRKWWKEHQGDSK